MRWMMVMLVAAPMALAAGNAVAQEPSGSGFEITPFGGYRWGGGLSTISGVRSFDTKDAPSYGLALGMRTPRNSLAEIVWTHFQANVEGQLNNGLRFDGGPLKRDDIMLNGTWYAYRYGSSVMPFITAGLGASIFSSSATSSVGRFAWDLGGGIRKDFSEKLGFRVTGLWMPTWVTTGTGLWCDPFYCYATGTGEYYDQFEVTGGLIIKL